MPEVEIHNVWLGVDVGDILAEFFCQRDYLFELLQIARSLQIQVERLHSFDSELVPEHLEVVLVHR